MTYLFFSYNLCILKVVELSFMLPCHSMTHDKLSCFSDMICYSDAEKNASKPPMLYDHRPLQLNEDDNGRVCHIPKKKVRFPSRF